MARDYARIMTAIWRDKDFLNLSAEDQRLYLLLVTQEDISAAGILALRVKRWAALASGASINEVEASLRRLEQARFVVIDWVAEELLVRSFVRWDGGLNNIKRRPVIMRAVRESKSGMIHETLVVEINRCGFQYPSDSASDSLSDGASDGLFDTPSKINSEKSSSSPSSQVDSLSDSPSRFDGVVVSNLSSEEPQPTTPKNIPPSAAATTAQDIVGEWIEGCAKRPPRAVIGQASKLVKAMLGEGIDPDDIRGGMKAWVAKGMHPSTIPSFVNEFMNRNNSIRADRGKHIPFQNYREDEFEGGIWENVQ